MRINVEILFGLIQDSSTRHRPHASSHRASGRENIKGAIDEKQRTKEIHIPLSQSEMPIPTFKSMPQPRAATEVKELDDAAM